MCQNQYGITFSVVQAKGNCAPPHCNKNEKEKKNNGRKDKVKYKLMKRESVKYN